jgi:hypothetical protein
VVITANGTAGLSTGGHSGIGLNNAIVYYHSSVGPGYYSVGGSGNWVQNTRFIDLDAPAKGPLGSASVNARGLWVQNSPNFIGRYIDFQNPGTGAAIINSNGTQLIGISGTNIRGTTGSSGQLVAFEQTANVSLDYFYAYNDQTISNPEDVISVWESSGVSIGGGVIDGSNGPTGSCIQGGDQSSHDVAVTNVQCIHALNQCFGAYGASGVYNVNYAYIDCRDMLVQSTNPRGPASSGQVPFVGAAPGSGTGWVSFENARYFNIPSGLLQTGTIARIQATSEDFTIWPHYTFTPPCQ